MANAVGDVQPVDRETSVAANGVAYERPVPAASVMGRYTSPLEIRRHRDVERGAASQSGTDAIERSMLPAPLLTVRLAEDCVESYGHWYGIIRRAASESHGNSQRSGPSWS